MACKLCYKPKLKEYYTALLLTFAGKVFAPERITKYEANADKPSGDFARDLAALPTLLADYPIGKWPATGGLLAAREILMGLK